MHRGLVALVICVALCALAFLVGYQLGQRNEAIKKGNPKAWKSSIYADSAIARDAIHRWSVKVGSSPERAMENRLIGRMRFPDRICVSLDLKPGSVGGVPIYCYKDDSLNTPQSAAPELVAEYSDVE